MNINALNEELITGMVDQKCAFPRGKALGGTSVINYMIYNRGNRKDFDRWAANGNYGWSWNEVLPYFMKSEKAAQDLDPNFHGNSGFLRVGYNKFRTFFARAFVEAHEYFGIRSIDYNSGDQLGVSYLQSTTHNGLRNTAFRSFIQPILHRKNLHIMLNTRATKVLIDSNTKTAFGVEIIRNRKRMKIFAKYEVILSAGTFASPQLLMLSGIGPKEDLQRIKVPLIKNLPVGKTLYDHVAYLGLTFIANTTGEIPSLEKNMFLRRDLTDILTLNGRFTIPGGVEALSFIKTETSVRKEAEIPSVELLLLSGGLHSDRMSGHYKGLRITDELYNAVYKPLERVNLDTFTIVLMLFHPKSVGYMDLKSSNIFEWPRFYHNFFKHPDDVETLLESLKKAIQITQAPSFKRLGVRIHDIPPPNCAHIHFGTDDYWRCSIRTMSSTLHHQVSTCKMGPQHDLTSVVSPELKVHGINKLRVVDTSIIPESITAHTNAASFMIGEKASDMIRRQWSSHEL